MNSDEKGAKESASPVMGLLPVLILGAALGYAATLKFPADAWADRIALFSLGLVGAYVLLNAIDLALNVLALRADPIPAALNVADRDAVRAQADRLSGRAAVAGRARNLLRSWGLGGRPPQVVGLAGFQGAQARHQLYAGALFAALLLAVSAAAGAQRPLCGCLGLALGVIVLARQGLSLRVDRYIEDRLLSRLPAEIPRTAMTAAELAGALGGAIQEAFKKHVPQPEQMASAVQHAMEGAMRNVASAVEKLQKALGENQSVLSEKWAQTIASAAADLKGLKDAMASVSADLKGGLGAGAEQLKSVLQAHTQGMEKTLAAVPGQLAGAYSAGAGQIEASFKQHAQQVQAAAQSLQDQLSKITEVGQQIDKILRVQQTVEGAVKSLAATEELAKTLATLRQHVESSDALLREVSRPRVIRLVESEGGIEQA